ncbi:MAG: exo-beta-N-acetylmuramidase NamZ domain-containing protein, partial [Myxococcota bacterium]
AMDAAGARLGALFGPEHGYGGEAQDMVGVESARDPATGAPIHSLYGDREECLTPRPEWLEGLDAVVVDLQDVGSRYYTYVWTAALMLKACAARGIATVVLDRPNPLGGDVMEGAPQRPGYRSFVGLYDVPVRHGMTLAEILRYVCSVEGLPSEALEVVPMQGWRRSMRWEDTGLPWVAPSPNMPTLDTARVYPGGCLLEGTNLSEGRGTTRPFEIWGAPSLDGARLATSITVPGAALRPLTFLPMFQKHAGRICGGVQVHVTDERVFRPYAAYLRLIAEARRGMATTFRWRTEPYEFVADRPAIDLLTGGPEYRTLVEGEGDVAAWIAEQDRGAAAFEASRRAFLLY